MSQIFGNKIKLTQNNLNKTSSNYVHFLNKKNETLKTLCERIEDVVFGIDGDVDHSIYLGP